MKKLIFINLIFASFLFGQSKTFTLEESIQIGLENSKEIKISSSRVVTSDAKLTEVTSQMLPAISFGASYMRLSDIPPFEVQIPGAAVPVKIQDPVLNAFSLKLGFQQPLFTGFRLSSLRSAAKLNLQATEIEHSGKINSISFIIQEAFWNYYKSKQVLSLVTENVKSLEQHVNDTKKFLDNGLATRNDLLKLEVRLSNTKLLYVEAKNRVRVTKAAFNKAIGLPLDSDTDVYAGIISVNKIEKGFDELLPEAFENRDELKSLGYRVKAGGENVSAANAAWFPSVYLSGNYYYNNPNQRIMPQVDEFNDTWDVGVSLKWDIWNWGKRSSQVEQAKQLLVQSEMVFELTKEAVQLDVYSNYLQLQSEIEMVELSRLTLEQAEENYRITKDKYNYQLATSTDLIDADVSKLNAQTNLTNALVDYVIAKVKLEKSLGRKIY